MLSIAALSDSTGASAYFCEHREVDYYVNDSAVSGSWVGAAARDLGLNGIVDQESLIAILEGRHLSSGRTLVPAMRSTHRPGWDCTFSAPKGVSILHALLPEKAAEEIVKAHSTAVHSALSILEREALVARRGRGGQVHERAAGLIAAVFPHHLSRNLDPQLHSHCLIANLAPRMDGTFGAIESKAIYQWKMALGAVYRAELSARVQALGYSVEADGNSFRIAGIPTTVEKVFSTRRDEIRQALSQSGQTTARRAEVAALQTRSKKIAANGIELDGRWNQQLESTGYGRHDVISKAAESFREHRTELSPRQRAIAVVLRELTDQQSVFRPRDIYKVLALEAQTTGVGLSGVEDRYQEVVRHVETVHLRDNSGELLFSTHEMRELENRLVSSAVRDAALFRHRLKNEQLSLAASASGSPMSTEQNEAVEHCCIGGDIAIVNGIAGSGKSALASVIQRAYKSSGYRVLGAALSGKAAQALEHGSGIPSQTLHSLLSELDRHPPNLGRLSVVVLDEAAMVGSRLMARLHAHIQKSGAKLILIGDARQLQPIEAGGIYNALLHRIGCASLTTIRRQREAWAADAVKDLAAGRAERVLTAFKERGQLVSDKDSGKLRDRLVRDWFEVAAKARMAADTLMLAGSRSDVAALNRAARDVMREHNKLIGEELTSERGTPWSRGDRILLTRNSRLLGARNGDLGIVRSVWCEADGLHFVVDLDDGRVARFGPDYPHIDHGYAVTVHKSQGSTVENAFVLINEQMVDREWGYVALSRARGQTRLYCPAGLDIDLARALERSRPKDTSLDYDPAMASGMEAEHS